MTSSGLGSGMTSSLVSQPPLCLSSVTNNIASSYGTSASLGAQQLSGSTSYSATATHNLSPLPIRANQISTMPPLCQVLNQILFYFFLISLLSPYVSFISISISLYIYLHHRCCVIRSLCRFDFATFEVNLNYMYNLYQLIRTC